jgi:hypothetical protein
VEPPPPPRLITAVAVFSLAVLVPHTRAADAPANLGVSANWSGYVATGARFSGVAGSWTVPSARCLTSSRRATAAAFWVGLGGALPGSRRIEQVGTAYGCNLDGSVTHFAWYELWPKRPVPLSMDVEAGDRIRASVRLDGVKATLTLVDLTSGRRFSRTTRVPLPDASSAEWIGEAPAVETAVGTRLVPLTTFSRVTFSRATASANGRTAAIGDRAWTATRVKLGSAHRLRVVPTALGAGGRAFSLRWAGGAA